MARLPDHLDQAGHITRDGDRVVVHIRADVSGYLTVARNLGPAWDRLAELSRRLGDLLEGQGGLAHRLRHHGLEDPRISTMHAAYDRRRRARRRRR